VKRYLNKAEKQTALTIASLQTYMEDKVAKWEQYNAPKELLKNARYAVTYTKKMLQCLLVPLDLEERAKLVLETRKMQCVVMYNKDAEREYRRLLEMESVTPVETEDLYDIAEQAINICVQCEKTGPEADNCNLRRIMLKYHIEPLDPEAPPCRCPYKYKD
jgi:hypothetical protein